MPLIPAFRRQGQTDLCVVKAGTVYIGRHCLKPNRTEQESPHREAHRANGSRQFLNKDFPFRWLYTIKADQDSFPGARLLTQVVPSPGGKIQPGMSYSWYKKGDKDNHEGKAGAIIPRNQEKDRGAAEPQRSKTE